MPPKQASFVTAAATYCTTLRDICTTQLFELNSLFDCCLVSVSFRAASRRSEDNDTRKKFTGKKGKKGNDDDARKKFTGKKGKKGNFKNDQDKRRGKGKNQGRGKKSGKKSKSLWQ